MSSDDYQIQNIYRYSRKSYNKNRSAMQDNDCSSNPRDEVNADLMEHSPRSDAFTIDSPGCSCDLDPEGEIANILHRKCPVITLAQQQLLRLLDETNRIVADHHGHWSPIYHLLCVCKEVVLWQNKCRTILVGLIFISFFFGLLLGAATCGTYSGKFNNPILNCIDNFFVPDSYLSIEDTFHSIA